MVKRLFKKNRRDLALTLARSVLLILLLSFHPLLASPASVWVSPSVVAVDETVTLTIAQDSIALDPPDLSVLKENFRIVKKTSSSSIQKVNGVTVIKKRWVLVLLPLKSGKLIIPSIPIGAEKTPPLSLKVTDDSVNKKSTKADSDNSSQEEELDDKVQNNSDTEKNAKAENNTQSADLAVMGTELEDTDKIQNEKHVIIKVEVDDQPHYVQGQVLLSQKIFHAVPLKKAHLTTPEVKDNAADIVQLSQVEPYYWDVDGKRYRVIERNYALFPKHSGTLIIGKAEFHGEARQQQPGSNSASTLEDPFGLHTTTTDKLNASTDSVSTDSILTASAPAVTVNILPQEEIFSASHWLPAKNITLYRKWSTPLDELKEGDTVVMQTNIIADGLRAEQLPEIFLETPENVKSYAEQAELTNTITHSGVTGVWSQKMTLVPFQSGEFTIPELKIPWWNITTEREELAEIKNEVLLVASPASTPSVKNTSLLSTSQATSHATSIASNSTETEARLDSVSPTDQSQPEKQNSENGIDDKKGSNWGYLILPALFFLGYLFFKNKSSKLPGGKTISNTVKTKHKERNPQHILDALKQSCLSNTPQDVEPLLLLWAKQVASIRPATLEGISSANNGYLRPEVERLSQSLYARSQTNWKGMSLWDAIKKYPYPDNTAMKQRDSRLKDMYPS